MARSHLQLVSHHLGFGIETLVFPPVAIPFIQFIRRRKLALKLHYGKLLVVVAFTLVKLALSEEKKLHFTC